ncbi:MAG: glycosyltransferase family 4 protein [Desulfobulbaceae bacterium]|nr:glycosyltransferase family 4 protein [Desulfobulbaceae bacterium]
MRKLPAGAALFSPGYNAPLLITRPYIFTIHDLNHLDRPENSSFLKRLYYRLIMRRAARKAFRVLTVSEFSRRRIIEWAELDPARVINVGNGVEPHFNPNAAPFEPGHPYLLCVGNRKVHKNETRMIEAFTRAEINPAIRLLFTGTASQQLTEIIKKFVVKNRVSFLGNVPEENMPGLYRGALALLFPSLYEGFGLPVIEAMACGTPVLTANTTALPEAAGDAALLINPLSVEEIAEGIEQLCRDQKLREVLRRRGLARAALFNWDQVKERVEFVLSEMQFADDIPRAPASLEP